MSTRYPQNRGFALIIVLSVIALAAVLGYAMLTTASLSAQIDHNTTRINSAETLADSGVELAAYYLLHPENAPTLNADGYWPGGTNISLGGTLRIDSVTVTRTAPKTFNVTATASSGASSPSRTIRARFYVDSTYVVKNALAANGSVDLSRGTVNFTKADSSTTATVRVDGTLQVAGSLLGTVVQAVSSTVSSITAVPTYPAKAVPAIADLTLTASLPNYTYNGQVYVADELTSDPGATLVTTHPATNPANVWYSTSTRKVNLSNTTINGTLIILGNSSTLELTNSGGLKIRPVSGMPALVVSKELKLSGSNTVLDAEGLVWVGEEINSVSGVLNILTGLFSGPVIKIKGALMMGNPTSSGSGYRGQLNINYATDNLTLKDFTNINQTPSSVKVLSWQ